MNNAYHIIGDFHTHTIASQHAYSTIYENLVAARRQGLVALAITDHGPEMMDGAIRHHFFCMTGLPKNPEGIRLYRGCEANIKSFSGRLDLDDQVLGRLEWVIASYHVEAIEPGSFEQNTWTSRQPRLSVRPCGGGQGIEGYGQGVGNQRQLIRDQTGIRAQLQGPDAVVQAI